MSPRAYSRYKNSGVGWLGNIPAHWDVWRLQDVASVISGHPFDSKLFAADGEYPLIRIRDLGATETATRYSGEFVKAAAVTSTDVLIGMDGDFNVGRWLGHGTALLNQRMCCIRTPSASLSAFLMHALPIPLKALNDVTYATTVKHLSSADVEKFRIALPPDSRELDVVASFLYFETDRIDRLIAEQEKLITLLSEKLQATISSAILRGLSSNVVTKDSGVNWLGRIPSHWSRSRIKHIAASIEQGWSPQCENFAVDSPEEWGVLRVGCVNGGRFQAAENKKLPLNLEPLSRYSIKRGDLLISRANTRELVGSAAVAPADFHKLMLCDKLYRLRVHDEILLPEFLAAYLGTQQAKSQIQLQATGASSSMLNIGQTAVLDLIAPVPPVSEQRAIMDFIESETNRFESLKAEVDHAVVLLKERRSSVIAAAVTGQIDVRNATFGVSDQVELVE